MASKHKPCWPLIIIATILFYPALSHAFIEPQKIPQGSQLDPTAQPPSEDEEKKEVPFAAGNILIKLKPAISVLQTGQGGTIVQSGQSTFTKNATKLNWLFKREPLLASAKITPVFGGNIPRGKKRTGLSSQDKNEEFGLDRWMKVEFSPLPQSSPPLRGRGKGAGEDEEVIRLCEVIMATGEVDNCQPNYTMTAYALPNDTYIDPDQNGTWSTGAFGVKPSKTYGDSKWSKPLRRV